MKKVFSLLAITLVALTISASLTQYEVNEAVNATLAQDDSIAVRGVVSAIEFYPNEFVVNGSVFIYLKDATGTTDMFELNGCYSLNADTFKTASPEFNPKSQNWFGAKSVTSKNGTTLHVGDTVVAIGKYTYSEQDESYGLQDNCYLTSIVKDQNVIEPEKETLVFEDGYIDGRLYDDYGVLELYLTNIPIDEDGYLVGDGDFLFLTFYPESNDQPAGTFTADGMTLDLEYSILERDAGADTTYVVFVDGLLKLTVVDLNLDEKAAVIKIEASLVGEDDKIYIVSQTLEIGYYPDGEEPEPEEGFSNTQAVTPQNVVIKSIENGQLILKMNNVRYNINGAIVK